MKKIFSLSLASILITLNACKKEKNEEVLTIKTEVYSGTPNTEDAVVATSVFDNSDTKMFLNGSFNEKGLPTKPRSIVLEDKANNIRGNYIFDDSMRIQYIYASDLNGENDRILMQFSYPSNDTIIQRIYDYNWNTGQDSLMVEQHIDRINWAGSSFAYGKTTGSLLGIKFSDEEDDKKFRDEGYGEMLDYFPDLEKGVGLGFASNKFNTFTAALVKAISKTLDMACDANAGIKKGLNNLKDFLDAKREAFRAGKDEGNLQAYESLSDYIRPPSPTAIKSKIPNPKGTPQNPTGSISNIVGTWKITAISNEFDELEPIPAYEQDNLIIYKADNTVTIDEGASKKTVSDEQQYSKPISLGTFIVGNDVNTFSGSRFNGLEPELDIDDTPARVVTMLTATTLKLEWVGIDGKSGWRITYTKQP